MEFLYLLIAIFVGGMALSALTRAFGGKKKAPLASQRHGDPTDDWKLEKHVRHDGVERDEYTHRHMLRSNSAYRDAADGVSAAPQNREKSAAERSDWEFEITYRSKRGKVSVRRIKKLSFNGDRDPLITAFCEKSGEERSFRSSNILACTNLESGRAIKDFGAYLKRGYGWR